MVKGVTELSSMMTPLKLHNGSLREPIPKELLGSAVLDRTGDFEAGSYQSFTLTYTAGRFGIDDSGSIRIVFRFATDQTNPQFDDPTAPGFTEVVASNNAVLQPILILRQYPSVGSNTPDQGRQRVYERG